jgi:DNA-binding NtrC family response regulator
MPGRRPIIAVVDDELLHRTWLSEHLDQAGYDVVTAADGNEGQKILQETGPDMMLLDVRLPGRSGIELLSTYHAIDRDLVIIMMTAYGEIETAVQALKAGAHDFLEKPLDADNLVITIDKALEARRLRHEVAVLREQHRWQFADVELVGKSELMRQVVESVEKIARSDSATVLLRGESGTGKDLVARAIHAQSQRRDRPFLALNCTVLPDQLLESELFGHERGAFTDAKERKKGLAELADGGTLFLDEIGDMPPAAQAKILRFLEGWTFKRLGGTVDLKVDVRVIAATNHDLEADVQQGGFRGDLYYRLNVVPVTVPPLRHRPEDIEPLAAFFLDKLATDLRRTAPQMALATLRLLEAYAWHGNVRELRNILERILILEDVQELLPEHLPPEIRDRGLGRGTEDAMIRLPHDGVRLADVEADLIRQALDRTGGNVSRAARLLGVSRDTLRYRLEKSEAVGQ